MGESSEKSLNLIDKEKIEKLLKTKEEIQKDLNEREQDQQKMTEELSERKKKLKDRSEERDSLETTFRMTEGAIKVSIGREEKLLEAMEEEKEKMDKLHKQYDAIKENPDLSDDEKKERTKQVDDQIKAQEIVITDLEDSREAQREKTDDLTGEVKALKDHLEFLNDDVAQMEDHVEALSQEIESIAKDIMASKSEIKSIEYSPEIVKYEQEKATRESHASNTFPNTERQATLLNGKDDEEALKMFDADTKIMIDHIRELLGNPDEGLVNNMVSQSNAMTAKEAMILSQKSLFDIKSAGIEDRIMQAANAGQTDIMLDASDVPATHMLALTQLGYKITHTDKKVIIDWGWNTEGGS